MENELFMIIKLDVASIPNFPFLNTIFLLKRLGLSFNACICHMCTETGSYIRFYSG